MRTRIVVLSLIAIMVASSLITGFSITLINANAKHTVLFSISDANRSTNNVTVPIQNEEIQIFGSSANGSSANYAGLTNSSGQFTQMLKDGTYAYFVTSPDQHYPNRTGTFTVAGSAEISLSLPEITHSAVFVVKDVITLVPLPNVGIQVYGNNQSLVFNGVTNTNGIVKISGLFNGNYSYDYQPSNRSYVGGQGNFVINNTDNMIALAIEDPATSGPIGNSVDTGYGQCGSASFCIFTNTISGTQYYYAMVGLGYNAGSSCALTAGCQVGMVAFGGPGNAGGATGTEADFVIQDAEDAMIVGTAMDLGLGIYYISHQLNFTAARSLSLIGSGYAGTFEQGNGTTIYLASGTNLPSGANHMIYSDQYYFKIQDLTIYGNDGHTTGNAALELDSYDPIVKNIAVFASPGNGINMLMSTGNGGYLTNVYSEMNTYNGIYLSVGGDSQFAQGETHFSHIDVFDNGQCGISISGGVERTDWTSLRVERQTTAGGCGLKMVATSGTQAVPRFNVFADSWFEGNAQYGIILEGAQNNTFSNDFVQSNSQQTNDTYPGIFLEDAAGYHCEWNIFSGIQDDRITGLANMENYGFLSNDANQDYNVIIGSLFLGAATGIWTHDAAHTQVHLVYNGSTWIS